MEQSIIGGCSHLLSFVGSDTMSAAFYAQVRVGLHGILCMGLNGVHIRKGVHKLFYPKADSSNMELMGNAEQRRGVMHAEHACASVTQLMQPRPDAGYYARQSIVAVQPHAP